MTADTVPPGGYPRKWTAFAGMAAGQFISVADMSAVGVALPTLAGDLDLPLPLASWVALTATLTISAVLLPTGGLSDVLGRKRTFVAGTVLFALGAIGCAAAPGLLLLLLARVVQSVGSAIISINGFSIVAVAFPPGERGKGVGALTTTVGLGGITGPVAGGALAGAFGWRSVFLMLAAGGAVSALLALLLLESRRFAPERGRSIRGFDWTGAFVSAAALTLLILAMNSGARMGWTSPLILSAWIAGACLFAAFVLWELRTRRPTLDVRMFLDAGFRWASITRYTGFIAQGTVRFLMPFYLQDVLEYPPGRVGLAMLPVSLGMAVFSSVSGRLSDRFGVRPFMIAGLAMVVASSAVFSTLGRQSSLYLIMPVLFLNGSGLGLWDAPNAARAISAVRTSAYSSGSAVVNLVRNAGNATSVALASAVVSGVVLARGFEPDLSLIPDEPTGGMARAFLAGARYAYLIPAAVGLIALLAALKTRTPQTPPPAPRSPAGRPTRTPSGRE
ncbi:MAG: MFS transporter [Gemmatimonadetes bacterium]|nr:MFS transporter [Gemmatimonadota bacterium]